MSSFINTNMASLNTQRNLSSSQSAMSQSIQRLSSGMRVNGAKDDAAGLGIANRMDSVIRGQNVAVRNSNDAISFSQTQEGALSKVNDSLQRMRELAVQSSNSVNGSDDRTSMDTEFKQLQSEITRVVSGTQFNGKSVMDGQTQQIQIGAGTTDGIDTIQMTGTDFTAATSATAKAAAVGGSVLGAAKAALGTLTTGGTISYDAVTGQATSAGTASTLDQDKVDAYNTAQAAALISTAAGGLDKASGAAAGTAGITFNTETGAAETDTTATQADTTLVAAYNTGLSSTGIDTPEGATAAIKKIDEAIKEVSTASTNAGAMQNRFAAVISTLQTSTENQTAAKSRIMDTDYAAETGTMARNSILQQAGMAMLAQANQLPNGVMALMR